MGGDMATAAKKEMMPFAAACAKFTIASLDDTKITISAQYNPGEVQIAQAVTWNADQKKGKGDSELAFQYGARQPRKYTVELLFDGVETDGKVGRTGITIAEQIKQLQSLVEVVPDRKGYNEVRPHFCVALWGGSSGIPTLTCVIENIATKYQRFDTMGNVLRATVTLSITEALRVDIDRKAKHVVQETWRSPQSVVDSANAAAESRRAALEKMSWIDPGETARRQRQKDDQDKLKTQEQRDNEKRVPTITGSDNSDR
jgi:hypothetical protein